MRVLLPGPLSLLLSNEPRLLSDLRPTVKEDVTAISLLVGITKLLQKETQKYPRIICFPLTLSIKPFPLFLSLIIAG